MREHVQIVNLEHVRGLLAQGTPVLIVAAHQCNWEWFLLALAAELGYPLDAAYKPLINPWAEREMLKLRTRFGARLVPADSLLADILQQRSAVRAICMVADQEPTQGGAQALAALLESRQRLLCWRRGDRAGDPLPGVLWVDAPHRAGQLPRGAHAACGGRQHRDDRRA